YAFIKNKDLKDVFKISKLLLGNKEDLMHKAVGWMLREAGKVDEKKLTDFLKQNYTNIPRTTLRYAIERFPEKRRKLALSGTF
ncbi:MAG: DNA alkylation repair protein, partial [Bdellovibrionales bacterium]|nr:DNA alkylation repair protein [Bdellovibrionales bacterium]